MSLKSIQIKKSRLNEKEISSSQAAIRVLVIEDDEQDFFIISEFIRDIQDKKFMIDWCYDFDEALQSIRSSKYDIYFVDYLLGEKTGIDLLKDAKKNDCSEPIVFLTGLNRKEVDMQAMKEGAVDYLIKSELNTEKIERCIRYALERNAYLKALRSNERKFYSVFEKSRDAIFLADEKLAVKDCNYAMTELFKYKEQELLKLNLSDLFAQKEMSYSLENELQKNGEAENKEVIMIAKNGEKKSCILSLSLEINEKGQNYIQGIIHDITNLIKIEKAKAQIEKLKSTAFFLRSLAHEIRNPLLNISLSMEEIKPALANSETENFENIIRRNIGRIDDLISQLLDSARSTEIEAKKVVLQDILDKAIAAASDRICLKKIKLQIEYPENPIRILADAEKLKMAFLNILINAIEALNENTGRLNILITQEISFNKVIIRDNGVGISEENLSRIFDPYFTSKANGFGLGLVSTLNILQSHKASVDVQSAIGEGTVFIIQFENA